MNTAELETLIRTILSEKLAPATASQDQQGIFRDVGSAIDAAARPTPGAASSAGIRRAMKDRIDAGSP